MRIKTNLGLVCLLIVTLFSSKAFSAGIVGNWHDELFLDGKSNTNVTIRSFEGKPIILMFFTTWCGFCEAELPKLSLYKKVLDSKKDNELQIIPILSEDKTITEAKEFLARVRAENLPIYIDRGKNLFHSFGIRGVPTFFLISKDGMLMQKTSSLNHFDPDIINKAINGK